MERCRKRNNKNSNQERSNRRKARKELQDYAEADLKEAKRIEEDSDEEVVHSGKVASRKEKEARRKLNDLPSIEVLEKDLFCNVRAVTDGQAEESRTNSSKNWH